MTIPHAEIIVPVVGGTALIAMTVTADDIVSVLGALGIFAAALAGAYSLVIAARVKAVEAKVDKTAATATETLAVVKVVEGQGNSAKTKAEGIIEAQAAQMVLLQETIEKQDRAALLLAQAAATQSTEALLAGKAPVPVASSAEHSLKKIDTNTKAIEQNTARTEAAVDELKK